MDRHHKLFLETIIRFPLSLLNLNVFRFLENHYYDKLRIPKHKNKHQIHTPDA